MLGHQPGGSLTLTYYFYNGFPSSTCFQFPRSATFTYWTWISLSPWNTMEKKGEEWQKNADTAQQHQAVATASLVCASRAARDSNIKTEPMNTEGWNIRAAGCYRQCTAALVSLLTECGHRKTPRATQGQTTATFSYKNWTHTESHEIFACGLHTIPQ
jgi:hypothetical protein